MGRLGDVLEVFYGPNDRFQTVQATIRQHEKSLDPDLADELRRPVGRKKEGMPDSRKPPGIIEEALSVWIARPDRARIEMCRRGEDRPGRACLVVINGPRRWERDAEGHVQVADEEDRGRVSSRFGWFNSDVDRHFCSAQIREFFHYCTLEALGPIRVAGRDCERIRAVPREGGGIWPHWLPKRAEFHEFHADPGRGVLLAIQSWRGGEVFATSEVVDVAFDISCAEDLFTYEPAPGEQVGPKVQSVEQLSLAGAVAKMPFAVLIPTRVPNMDRSACHFMYFPPRRGQRSCLRLVYFKTEGFQKLSIIQGRGPDPGLDQCEWERIDLAGDVLKDLRISDPGGDSGDRLVAFEQEGTHVVIQSDLDRERLIDLATSFVPASSRIIPADSLIIR